MDKPTMEQIDNQPAGKRMDEWIAEFVMKWELLLPGMYKTTVQHNEPIPDFTTDIASAYQVIDKMIGMGYDDISINHEPMGTGWDVVFWPPSDEKGISADYAARCAGIAETNGLPLAISRAALKTVLFG